MKLMTILSTTALAVLLGISVPVFAQDDSHPQEEKRAEPVPNKTSKKTNR